MLLIINIADTSVQLRYKSYYTGGSFHKREEGTVTCYNASFVIKLFASLTLRLLMSYIYMEHLFLMFLDHTQRRSTVGRNPLDE